MPRRSSTRFIARVIPGARPTPYPGFFEPVLATTRDAVPAGSQWVHEIKLDGYRIQPHRDRGAVVIYSRGGLDWTARFAPIVAALGGLPVEGIILDGEVVVIRDGRPSFSELQADLAAGRTDRMQCYLFDLLYIDGFDLRASPLVERKRVLERLLREAKLPGPVLYSEHMDDGASMFEHACALGWEGVISKRRDAPYRSGRGESWIKVKCIQRGQFVIVGFILASGGQLAAIRLARRDEDSLRYIGKAGSGFTVKNSQELRKRLTPLVRNTAPLPIPARMKDTVWVEPQVIAKIDYSEFTNDGTLRHPIYKGFDGER